MKIKIMNLNLGKQQNFNSLQIISINLRGGDLFRNYYPIMLILSHGQIRVILHQLFPLSYNLPGKINILNVFFDVLKITLEYQFQRKMLEHCFINN